MYSIFNIVSSSVKSGQKQAENGQIMTETIHLHPIFWAENSIH